VQYQNISKTKETTMKAPSCCSDPRYISEYDSFTRNMAPKCVEGETNGRIARTDRNNNNSSKITRLSAAPPPAKRNIPNNKRKLTVGDTKRLKIKLPLTSFEKLKLDLHPSSSSSSLELQPTRNRRRYLRRGSKCPSMLLSMMKGRRDYVINLPLLQQGKQQDDGKRATPTVSDEQTRRNSEQQQQRAR